MDIIMRGDFSLTYKGSKS